MTDADFEEVTIVRKDAPDVRFRGKLLVEVDSLAETRQESRKKDRWTKLELWELESGNWVAASIACSDKDGEVDFGEVLAIQTDLTERDRWRAAMTFWGWSWLGKALARKARWDVVEELR